MKISYFLGDDNHDDWYDYEISSRQLVEFVTKEISNDDLIEFICECLLRDDTKGYEEKSREDVITSLNYDFDVVYDIIKDFWEDFYSIYQYELEDFFRDDAMEQKREDDNYDSEFNPRYWCGI